MHSINPHPPDGSVLVVDDSAVQRRHAVKLCHELGIKLVHEAENGQKALELIVALAVLPSLLIVDLEMPEMDGIELIEALQKLGISVPIVLASSREDTLIESVQAMGLTVMAGLPKPLTLESLGGALKDCAASMKPKAERRKSIRLPIDAQMLALAIKANEISPHFQPKVDTRTGLMRGVEALARWQHPTLGMVPPDEFIPMAEREGLIHALTLSMMQQSFSQCAAWSARGMHLTVAVNLSPKLLESADIVAEICALQRQHGLDPAQVVLEVTEGSVVDSYGAALGVLARLRLKGFGLSIDDYGTGFSSMQQLSRIPFTELKIDRSFVHGAHRRKSLRVILESALDMARRLDLTTVAEGVETLEDWRLLQDFGCTACQGWLIAKAMPSHELQPWTKTHSARLPDLRAKTMA